MVITISILSIVVNLVFINRYYIYEKRKILESVATSLVKVPLDEERVEELEREHEVVIVYTDASLSLDNLNEELRYLFEMNKIKLNKFWITQETLDLLNERSVNKLYDQGLSKYRVLTKFLKIDQKVYAIGMPLAQMDETIHIVNRFQIIVTFLSVMVTVWLVALFSRRIVKPLEELKELSKEIALLNFKRIEIHTNDEIGELAVSINKMSESLEQSHSEINAQNRKLKQLLSDISHELKTPLALIKVYNQGMEDGFDDGSYGQTIKEQTERMNCLIERLLFWAKLDEDTPQKQVFSFNRLVSRVVRKYHLLMEQNEIQLIYEPPDKDCLIEANQDQMEMVLDNFITNAIKYTNNQRIEIILKEEDYVKFRISNGIDQASFSHIHDIWNPFYVAEASRNKDLSGTGLGLSIVYGILNNHEVLFGLRIIEETIEFYIDFCNNPVT